MKFIDSTIIHVQAGKGGDGVVSFAAAKFEPMLGPDGGDGGKGGNVILLGTTRLNTLSAMRFKQRFRAEDGVKGGPCRRRGKTGEDLILQVPLGTIVTDAESGQRLGELIAEGDTIVVAKGGRHGLGNTHWATSTHQVPEETRPGDPGESRELKLELKLLADVGLAGFPNAGKSTLLSRISAARPKIADYPFTTLTPNLGVVDLREDGEFSLRSLVVADVPGLIEGASEGRGLGHAFLKHLERTRAVAFIIDAADYERKPAEALAILKSELASFSPKLAERRSLVVINKIDALDEEMMAALETDLKPIRDAGDEVLLISAAAGTGLLPLKRRLFELVQSVSDAQENTARDTLSQLADTRDDADPWAFATRSNAELAGFAPVKTDRNHGSDARQ
jgi:GTP-binding protein